MARTLGVGGAEVLEHRRDADRRLLAHGGQGGLREGGGVRLGPLGPLSPHPVVAERGRGRRGGGCVRGGAAAGSGHALAASRCGRFALCVLLRWTGRNPSRATWWRCDLWEERAVVQGEVWMDRYAGHACR